MPTEMSVSVPSGACGPCGSTAPTGHSAIGIAQRLELRRGQLGEPHHATATASLLGVETWRSSSVSGTSSRHRSARPAPRIVFASSGVVR